MDVPPAVDSPLNILVALDNNCIQEILSRLKTRADFFNAAEVCTRFQANAISCFPPELGEISIGSLPHGEKRGDEIPTQHSHRFLSIFGRLIKEIHWFASGNPTNDSKILEAIARFCGKTLIGFHIRNYNSKFPKKMHFKALQRLTLDGAAAMKFKYHSQLKYLRQTNYVYIPAIKTALRMRKYPHLEHLVLHEIHTLTHDMFTKFLTLNPQLKKLEVDNCDGINLSIFRDVADYLPNLEQFCFKEGDADRFPPHIPYSDWMHLGRFRNLRHLELEECIPFSELVDVLVENDVQIEYLYIEFPYYSPDISENISQLKSLRKMELKRIKSASLIRLIESQPSLEEITINGRYDDPKINEIGEAFSVGKNLSKLMFFDGLFRKIAASGEQVVVTDCGRAIKVEVSIGKRVHPTGRSFPTRMTTYTLERNSNAHCLPL